MTDEIRKEFDKHIELIQMLSNQLEKQAKINDNLILINKSIIDIQETDHKLIEILNNLVITKPQES